MEKISKNDLLTFQKLGIERYIDGMSIQYILPRVERLPNISKSAAQRLKWMDYYDKGHTVAQTSRYFGIAPKTFHKWRKRYNPNNLASLEDRPRRPKQTRRWEVTREEERRVLALRTRYIRYGKMKLMTIYQTTYQEPISSWKVQRVIEKHHLYYHPKKNQQTQAKRKRSGLKKRITELKKEPRSGFLIALDTICINVYGFRRYILTGIDIYGKIAFARMYPGHGSAYAADFLKRIHYLLDGKIENIQTDNGSEFAQFKRLELEHSTTVYFCNPHSPWEKPQVESLNNILRRFIPRNKPLKDLSDEALKVIELKLHSLPRKCLGFATPIEAFGEAYA